MFLGKAEIAEYNFKFENRSLPSGGNWLPPGHTAVLTGYVSGNITLGGGVSSKIPYSTVMREHSILFY